AIEPRSAEGRPDRSGCSRLAARFEIDLLRRFVDLIDEFGAEFGTNPPCKATLARMVRCENEGEVRGDFQIFGNRLHAAIRYVRDRAVARQRTAPDWIVPILQHRRRS